MKIPTDKATGRNKSFAFICYRHSVSVPYAIELLNGIAIYGRNLKVQSRNHQHLQQKGLAHGPGGIHTLDPSFGKVQAPSGPFQPCGQQALLQAPGQQGLLQAPGQQVFMQGPSLLGTPSNNMMAMAQQQMALLNAFQPIPLTANPLLNAPRERYSDRHGSINYNRGSPYQRGNYSNDHRSNYSNSRDSSHNSNRNSKDKFGAIGDRQHGQRQFDYSRLGPPAGRDHHSSHNSDQYKRQDNRYDRQRSGSYHNHHDSSRRSDSYHDSSRRPDSHHERRHTDHHSSRSYRH